MVSPALASGSSGCSEAPIFRIPKNETVPFGCTRGPPDAPKVGRGCDPEIRADPANPFVSLRTAPTKLEGISHIPLRNSEHACRLKSRRALEMASTMTHNQLTQRIGQHFFRPYNLFISNGKKEIGPSWRFLKPSLSAMLSNVVQKQRWPHCNRPAELFVQGCHSESRISLGFTYHHP